MADRTNCRSCNAPVMFVRNVAGNLMILDAEPVPDGRIVIVDGVAQTLKGDMWEERAPEGPRYKDHHATCKQSEQWRKKKGKS
jgi:hypothetical protein